MESSVVVKQGTRRRLSRYGCRNCKLRKLKCDETKPYCMRCLCYGVACNFAFGVADLQPLHQSKQSEGASLTLRTKLKCLRAPVSNATWASSPVYFLTLDRQDEGLFSRFRHRTVQTMGSSEMAHTYETRLFQFAFTCPALMHGILGVAALHDRYLAAPETPRRSVRELYHSSRCTALFNDMLNQPIKEKDKDALWATAVILSIITFASVCVSSPLDAWPLKPADPCDLQWLKLKTSDRVLWHLADPMRPTSIFRSLMQTASLAQQHHPTHGADGVPVTLAKLCGLDDTSTMENNPYFQFVHALSRLLGIPRGQATLFQVFQVIGVVSTAFCARMESKDPVALALLYVWYGVARDSWWWIDLRARVEMPAIRAYLQVYHDGAGVLESF